MRPVDALALTEALAAWRLLWYRRRVFNAREACDLVKYHAHVVDAYVRGVPC